VAQEALTNVSKHAHATRVEVELSISGGVLTLEVRDDGRGLLRTDLEKARSFGIRGLHERAGTVGGWIDLASSARGTVLMLCVPLTHERREEMTSDFDDMDDDLDRSHDPSAWGSL
jgi:signal transduction histidine kinase